MSQEKILEQLKEMGVNPGEWKSGENVELKLPFLEKQKNMLENIKSLLEKQLDKDLENLDRLKELLHRVENGGGS